MRYRKQMWNTIQGYCYISDRQDKTTYCTDIDENAKFINACPGSCQLFSRITGDNFDSNDLSGPYAYCHYPSGRLLSSYTLLLCYNLKPQFSKIRNFVQENMMKVLRLTVVPLVLNSLQPQPLLLATLELLKALKLVQPRRQRRPQAPSKHQFNYSKPLQQQHLKPLPTAICNFPTLLPTFAATLLAPLPPKTSKSLLTMKLEHPHRWHSSSATQQALRKTSGCCPAQSSSPTLPVQMLAALVASVSLRMINGLPVLLVLFLGFKGL